MERPDVHPNEIHVLKRTFKVTITGDRASRLRDGYSPIIEGLMHFRISPITFFVEVPVDQVAKHWLDRKWDDLIIEDVTGKGWST